MCLWCWVGFGILVWDLGWFFREMIGECLIATGANSFGEICQRVASIQGVYTNILEDLYLHT